MYQARRQRVMDSLGGNCLVLASSGNNSFTHHGFHPDPNFYYLTGYDVPGCYLILSGRLRDRCILSLPPVTCRSMVYERPPPDPAWVESRYGIDRVISRQELDGLMDSILCQEIPVYTDTRNHEMEGLIEKLASGPAKEREFLDISGLLDEMRVIKDPLEVERLQKACNITSLALRRALEQCRPGKYEFEIESVIEGTFLEYGAARPGFPSIIGSGPNSTILHYEASDRRMESGDMLVMDVGAEYGSYTADITRTIPVNGRFSTPQRAIYQLVLDAQKAAIDKMVPGHGFIDGHMAAKYVIVDGLVKLGLITDPGSWWQVRFYVLYPASHYLGMDVHDVGSMGGTFARFLEETPGDSVESRRLEPGMVLTIEPGIYFRENGLEQLYMLFGYRTDSAEIEAFTNAVRPEYNKYVNIGVRIEDDILITEKGHVNLSRYAPREIEDIEQLMR